MPFIDSDGVKIHYELLGDGPDIVAISGLLSTTVSSQFRVVPGLQERFRLLLADHRGNGESDVPPPPYSIHDIADDWVRLMDHLEIEKAPIIGNSMGSMIATSLVLRHPERVSRLVLSVPTTHVDPWLDGVISHWQRVHDATGSEEFTRMTFLWTLAPDNYNLMAEQLDAMLAQATQAGLPEIPADGFQGQLDAMRAFDLRDQLAQIDVPTLILAGAEDRVCHPGFAHELHERIAGSELVFLEGAGHLAQTERGPQYADALLPFLDADRS